MSGIALVYVLFGDRESAQACAQAMVAQRLAACANLLNDCTSIYPWEGQIAQAQEVPVLFKTAPAGRAALMAALEALHGYDVPAILSWPAEATADYAAWVARETQG
ncbi:MAG: divalent-cation tolerance protein CutA [Sphingomonas sp.]|nr:divalent-cation tolerance protein CutA [Sphingomonas sp.]